MTRVDGARRWLRRRRGPLLQAARMCIAAAATREIVQALGLPQGYWAVFTVVIVMQVSVGGTLSAALDRLQGTVLGAGVGGLAAWLRPDTGLGLTLALAASVAVTSFQAARRPNLRVAPVTAVIMLISPGGTHGPLETAAYRVLEIAIGGGIGVLATFLLFPARSAHLAREAAGAVLDQLAEILGSWAGELQGAAADLARHDAAQERIRAALGGLETLVGHASREEALRLFGGRLSPALPRTLWRVRNDCVSLRRALGPLPEPAGVLVGGAMQGLIEAEAARMRRCADAVRRARPVVPGGEEAALARFEGAMADLRRSRFTHGLELEPVGRLFGLAFALESLHRNLNELTERIGEAGGAREG